MIPMDWLTKGERAVYERRVAGMTNSAIAAELGISSKHAAVNYLLARRRIANGGPPARIRRAPGHDDEALRRLDRMAQRERRLRQMGRPEACPPSIYALAASRPG